MDSKCTFASESQEATEGQRMTIDKLIETEMQQAKALNER